MALTPIQKALKAQRAVIKKVDGRDGVIARGGLSENVFLTIGETRAEEIVDNNMITTIRVRDFLIDVVEYRFNGQQEKPRSGDTITTAGKSYQVLPTSSEPEYRQSDRDETTWRIHTKEIS